MSKQYDETNRGILSRNDRKEQPTHPDMKGTINVDGVEYWLSGWTQTRKDGSGKFLSLSVKRKDEQQPTRPVQQKQTAQIDDDMDIPF